MHSKRLENMTFPKGLRRALAVLLASSALQALGTSGAWASPLAGQFSGGSHAVVTNISQVQGTLLLIKSAGENCPCQGTNGVIHSTAAPTVDLGSLGSVGNSTATSVAKKTATTAQVSESATAAAVSLFGGLITADAITGEANVGATPDTLTNSSAGTQIVNLKIAGQAIDPNVPVNSEVPLPGLGSVTVKLVQASTTPQASSILVEGLAITITKQNQYGLAVGAQLVVGRARAGYSRTQPAVALDGAAAAARVTGDASLAAQGTVRLGAAVGLPGCNGSDGDTRTRTSAGLDLPGLATATVAKVTAFGGPVGTAEVAKMTATISNVSVFGGLITADTITAVAKASRTGNVSTGDTTGSQFTGLTIAGLPIPVNSKPNLTINLAGLGTVIVNKQTFSPSGGTVQVDGLDIVITGINLMGLPIGTHLDLASALAGARKF